MTKRPPPFEPSTYRQSKIHFNNFENDLSALREVEERTIKKLIEGSKKLHTVILKNADDSHSENGIYQKSSNFTQKCVTNYFTVNGRKISEADRVIITPFEVPNRCFFCEARTNSVYQCAVCVEFYCSACSFINYESSEDRRICLSCS